MTKLYGRRIAAVLAADSYMEVRICRLAKLQRQFHQFTHACLIQPCERIIFKNLGIIVSIQELPGVITGESKGHLRQIVCTETEEVCPIVNDFRDELAHSLFHEVFFYFVKLD